MLWTTICHKTDYRIWLKKNQLKAKQGKNYFRTKFKKLPRRVFEYVLEHSAQQSVLSKWVIAIPMFFSSTDT